MLDDEVENSFDKKRDIDLENKIISVVGLINEVPYKMRTEIEISTDSKIIFRRIIEKS